LLGSIISLSPINFSLSYDYKCTSVFHAVNELFRVGALELLV